MSSLYQNTSDWDSLLLGDQPLFETHTPTLEDSTYANLLNSNSWPLQTVNPLLLSPPPNTSPNSDFDFVNTGFPSPEGTSSIASQSEPSSPSTPHYTGQFFYDESIKKEEDVEKPLQRQKKTQGARIAHTQVEKKYRASVNTAIKRLQHVIPDLAGLDEEFVAADGRTKPTKASVIIGGVAYIKMLEKEQERLKCENERLRKIAMKDLVLMDRIMYGDE
jgi:hypothetical protein